VVWRLIWIAVAARIASYILFNVLLFGGEFQHPDSAAYHLKAILVAESWHTGNLTLPLYHFYSTLMALMYFLFGPHRIIPEIVNMLAGVALTVLMFKLVGRLFDRRTALVAALLVAVDPSLAYWSTQLLRDSLLVLLVIGAVYFAVNGYRSSLRSAAAISACLLGVILFGRVPLAASVGLAITLSTVAGLVARGQVLRVWALASVGMLGAGGFMMGMRIYQAGFAFLSKPLEYINQIGPGLAGSLSHIPFFDELNTPVGPFESYAELGLFAPEAVMRATVLPFPWLANSPVEMLFALAAIWWYTMLALAVVGMVSSPWNAKRLFVLGLVVVLLWSLGTSIMNMAGLVRWRLPVEALVLIWAARGALVLWGPQVRKVKVWASPRNTSEGTGTVTRTGNEIVNGV